MVQENTDSTVQTIGNYDLLEKIAEGGMGAIYKGRHRQNGQIVAVKIMPAHLVSNTVLLKRFEQEFHAASRLDHPNVVRAIDFDDSGSTPYLVMEFVDGESLGRKLEREGRMAETDAIRIIAQVAQGLHRAHKLNLIHRDVKPDNILITPTGVAKLADLGLVKESEADLNLTRTGRGLGTPHFMAPEQFRNAKNADVRCDIYSLGATLYMMVTGELPFKSNGPLDAWMKKVQNELAPPRDVVPTLSERVDWAIMRAMNPEPMVRPASCREFVEDLTGHSTRRPASGDGATHAQQEMWYLVYRDEEGVPHTVKGNPSAIRRSLKEGLLGDASNVRAARTKQGPFEALKTYPEFRDLVVAASRLSGMSSVPPLPGTPVEPSAMPASKVPTPPLQARPSGTPSTPPPRPVGPGAPHIALAPRQPPKQASGSGGDWTLWVVLILVLAASAAAGFWLIPW
jgi:serine/threonine protein kinase